MKKNKKNKKSSQDDVTLLYYDFSKYLIPKLRKFKENSISYPHTETAESWNEKLEFIANKLEARIDKSFNSLSIPEQFKVKSESEKAARMLGEIWFDLWS